MDTDARTFYKTREKTAQNPGQLRLQVAALRLKHQQCPPSALALSYVLNVSRSALYRRFGAKAIQDALMVVRDDAKTWVKGRGE